MLVLTSCPSLSLVPQHTSLYDVHFLFKLLRLPQRSGSTGQGCQEDVVWRPLPQHGPVRARGPPNALHTHRRATRSLTSGWAEVLKAEASSTQSKQHTV